MKLSAFKISNKATAYKTFVSATSADEALDLMAQELGAASFDKLLDCIHDTPLPRCLFEISRGYWKSDNVRGRFASKASAQAGAEAKGVEPRSLRFWYVETVK